MIDYWKLAETYAVGDLVQKFIPGRSAMSPYVGTVTAVMPGIGFVDIQWPFGSERVSPEELVKVDPKYTIFLPPGLDTVATKVASKTAIWRVDEFPHHFYLKLASLYHERISEVKAYDLLWRDFREANDETLRAEVQKFYRVAYDLVTALLTQEASKKTAAYWAQTDRKYRATKNELDARRVNCPKCKEGPMRKATYKMEGGQRIRLLACPHCMHLVKQTDILGPGGEQVEW